MTAMEYRVAFLSSTGAVRILDHVERDRDSARGQVDRMREAGMNCWLEQRPVTRWERVA